MADNNITSEFSARVWQNNLTCLLEVINQGSLIDSWQVVFESEYAIIQQDGEYEILGAEVIDVKEIAGGKYRYKVQPFDYNLTLDTQESVFIIFNAAWSEEEIPEPANIIFNTNNDSSIDSNNANIDVDLQVKTWASDRGSTVGLKFKNDGDDAIDNWQVKFQSDSQIRKVLNAEIISETANGGNYEYIIGFADNPNLEPKEKDFLRFTVLDPSPQISNLVINEPMLAPEPEPIVDPVTGTANLDVNVRAEVWGGNSGATVHLNLTNEEDTEFPDWQIKFQADFQIRDLDTDIWNAEIVSETPNEEGYEYIIGFSNNEVLEPGEKHYFGFNTIDATPEFKYIVLNDGSKPQPQPETEVVPEPQPQPEAVASGEVTRPDYNQSTGFFTLDGKIYDANGNEFVARGVNNENVWFDHSGNTVALNAIDNIADFGFNSIRIVWEIDYGSGLSGAATDDSMLERVIDRTIEHKMVPMVELHDFTGKNNTNELLDRGVKWWTDRAATWQKYEKSLMINIANEFGNYDFAQNSSRAEFPKVYKEAITRIRDAGINNTIVIDPFLYGKDYTLVEEYGREIYDHDSQQNVVFSIHFYCGEGSDPNKIRDAFDSITGQGLPMIVGEFSDTHPPCGDVREDVIMAEAEEHDVGYYAWSWTRGLGVVNDWEADSPDDVTTWGQKLIFGPHGVDATSELATIFND